MGHPTESLVPTARPAALPHFRETAGSAMTRRQVSLEQEGGRPPYCGQSCALTASRRRSSGTLCIRMRLSSRVRSNEEVPRCCVA
jgi:hypothetical protein